MPCSVVWSYGACDEEASDWIDELGTGREGEVGTLSRLLLAEATLPLFHIFEVRKVRRVNWYSGTTKIFLI